MTATRILAIALVCVTTAALAHDGVKNPAVKARMDAMSEIGAATKVLGQMAKGATAFGAGAAQAATDTIALHAAKVPDLFEANEDDPKSEALPAIWDNYGDFTKKADALEQAASVQIATEDDLKSALGAIGQTCKGCHRTYRE